MDDFNNFFDNNPQSNNAYTPIYHTPNQAPQGAPKNKNVPSIIAAVATVVMCIAIIVNVVVLATFKDNISEHLAGIIRDEYRNSIDDALKDKNIIDDVIDGATNGAIDSIRTPISELVADNCLSSTAKIICYDNGSLTKILGSGFLISDLGEAGATTRYLVTNAHVVIQEVNSLNSWKFDEFDNIDAVFESKFVGTDMIMEASTFKLKPLYVGQYESDNVKQPSITMPDIAIMQFVGVQPDNKEHPSLKIAKSDYSKIGTEIAIIGNPQGIGLSVNSGAISMAAKDAHEIWGTTKDITKFIMTDAAVNGGNSGGPMINRQLAIVGIVESKIVDEKIDNMAFAVSAETLIKFIAAAEGAKGVTIQYHSVSAPALTGAGAYGLAA